MQVNDPRRVVSDPSASQKEKRETAGANPPPQNPAMTSRVVQNAVKCCFGTTVEVLPEETKADVACVGPVPFQNPMAGECDIDFTFRADVDLVERFIPRNTPAYPPMSDPPCGVEGEENSTFLLDKASGLIQPVEYTPCFESWVQRGYQRDR